MKKYYTIPSSNVDYLINKLGNKYSLPTISFILSIYFQRNSDFLEISFTNGSCHARYYAKGNQRQKILKSVDYEGLPPITIENTNIKYLLETLYNIGLNESVISAVTRFDYRIEHKTKNSLELDTIAGHLLSFQQSDEVEFRSDEFLTDAQEITIAEIDLKIQEGKIKTAKVFDALGNIHPVIKDYMDKFGIELSLNAPTLRSRINSKSNDYLLYNDSFKSITGSDIYTTEKTKANWVIKPLTVVIPSYNSDSTIKKVLDSIQSQALSEEELRMVEVIVVDDGSSNSVKNLIDLSNYTFGLTVIRFESNRGRSAARNAGGYAASNQHLLFIDSDIILADNYIKEHSIRLQTVPRALFTSLKKNIDSSSDICNEQTISKGVVVPDNYNDKRLFRKLDKGSKNLLPIIEDGYYEFLSDTKYLANFGHGRVINGYDLPSFVISHNLSLPKELFLSNNGFSEDFNGWGLEDTFFGAQAIANGYFVIPILSTGVYHINHEPRSSSEKQKSEEYMRNIQEYIAQLNKPI